MDSKFHALTNACTQKTNDNNVKLISFVMAQVISKYLWKKSSPVFIIRLTLYSLSRVKGIIVFCFLSKKKHQQQSNLTFIDLQTCRSRLDRLGCLKMIMTGDDECSTILPINFYKFDKFVIFFIAHCVQIISIKTQKGEKKNNYYVFIFSIQTK